jgi:hypothetical protein
MICSISFFTTITASVSKLVRLPNGNFASVTHIGTVKISSTLTLTDVLCVPSFSFNLVSISKLTKNISCCVMFLTNTCYIQYLQTWKTIGVGKESSGLFHLQCDPIFSTSSIPSRIQSFSVNSVPSSTWHSRLGHLSDARMKLLSMQHPQIFFRVQ